MRRQLRQPRGLPDAARSLAALAALVLSAMQPPDSTMGQYPDSRLYRLARAMPDVRRPDFLPLFPDRTCARPRRRLALPVLPLRRRARPLRVVFRTLYRRPR